MKTSSLEVKPCKGHTNNIGELVIHACSYMSSKYRPILKALTAK